MGKASRGKWERKLARLQDKIVAGNTEKKPRIPRSAEFCASIIVGLTLFILDKTGHSDRKVFIVILGVMFLLLAHPLISFSWIAETTGKKRAFRTLCMLIFSLIPIALFGFWVLPPSVKIPDHLSLLDLFNETPVGYSRIAPTHTDSFKIEDSDRFRYPPVSAAALIDRFGSYTAEFYIPNNAGRTVLICKSLSDHSGPWKSLDAAIADITSHGFSVDSRGSERQRVGTPVFLGKVILFTEDPMSLSDKAEIEKLYQSKNLSVDFRDFDFVQQELIDRAMIKER